MSRSESERTLRRIVALSKIVFNERVHVPSVRVIKEREVMAARAIRTTDGTNERVLEMRETITIEF